MLRDDLVKLELPPGMVHRGTQYAVQGRWYGGNQVRWVADQLKPIGGWQRLTTSALTGKTRALLSWGDNSGDRWIAFGTSSNLYVSHGDATLYDITPAGFVTGTDDATESFGYGGGLYGAETYGTARSGGSYAPLALWSFDLWGHYLIACARDDGDIYEWQLNTGVDAAQITNSPTACIGVLVTDQRHILALGAGGDGRRVEWCDKEDNTVWTPAANNEAGGLDLSTQSPIKTGCKVGKTNLIVTRTDAHVMPYVGQPYIYGKEKIGDNCGTAAPKSLVSVGERAYWLGDGCFWQTDGAGVAPLECDVYDTVFGQFDDVHVEKIHAGVNPKFSEVTWFLPISGGAEPNRYVTYNYEQGWWSYGLMTRTAWDAGSVLGYPHAMGSDNHLYRHEDDVTDNGASRFASIYAESGSLEIGVGAQIGHINQIIQDEGSQGEMQITFRTRFTPTGDEYTYGPFTVRDDGYTDCRFAGRQAVMRVHPTEDGDFTLGPIRINVTPGGRR